MRESPNKFNEYILMNISLMIEVDSNAVLTDAD